MSAKFPYKGRILMIGYGSVGDPVQDAVAEACACCLAGDGQSRDVVGGSAVRFPEFGVGVCDYDGGDRVVRVEHQ